MKNRQGKKKKKKYWRKKERNFTVSEIERERKKEIVEKERKKEWKKERKFRFWKIDGERKKKEILKKERKKLCVITDRKGKKERKKERKKKKKKERKKEKIKNAGELSYLNKQLYDHARDLRKGKRKNALVKHYLENNHNLKQFNVS